MKFIFCVLLFFVLLADSVMENQAEVYSNNHDHAHAQEQSAQDKSVPNDCHQIHCISHCQALLLPVELKLLQPTYAVAQAVYAEILLFQQDFEQSFYRPPIA